MVSERILTVEEDDGPGLGARSAEHLLEVALALTLVLAQHVRGVHTVEHGARLPGRGLRVKTNMNNSYHMNSDTLT